MLEVLRQDYIRTAWSKGLLERAVILRHAVKNALIPVVSLVALQVPILVGGSVIMENESQWKQASNTSLQRRSSIFSKSTPEPAVTRGGSRSPNCGKKSGQRGSDRRGITSCANSSMPSVLGKSMARTMTYWTPALM